MHRQDLLARSLYCKKSFVDSAVTAALIVFWETYIDNSKDFSGKKLQLLKPFKNLHIPFPFFLFRSVWRNFAKYSEYH